MPVNRNGFHGDPHNQADVTAWWTSSGQQGPPPIVPPSLAGWQVGGGRDAMSLYRINPETGKRDKKSRRGYTEEERNFENFWGRTAIDPYRRQGGISRLAGNLLGAYGAVAGGPVWTAMNAVADAGNKALGTNDTSVNRDGVMFGDPAQYGTANTAAQPGSSSSTRPLGMAPIGDIPTYAPLMGTKTTGTPSSPPSPTTSSNLAGASGFTGTPAGTSPMSDTSSGKLPKGTQYTRRDPWYEQTGQAALGRATALADRPYTPFTGERVAGLSDNEQSGIALAGQPVNYQSQIDRLGQGYSGEAISGFMNPYVDAVLGDRTKQIDNSYTTQMAGLNRNAAATDSFRTGRSDRQRSQLDKSRISAIDTATNDTKKSAFENAQQAYFNQGNQDVSAIGALEGANRSRVGSLMDSGATERGIRQAGDDFDYGQHLERRDWDMNNLNSLLAAIGAVNGTAGTWNYGGTKDKKDSSTDWGAVAGAIASAYGEYNSGGG